MHSGNVKDTQTSNDMLAPFEDLYSLPYRSAIFSQILPTSQRQGNVEEFGIVVSMLLLLFSAKVDIGWGV